MKLKELADLIMIKEIIGNTNIEITGLQMDSRKIEKGNLFVCVPAIEGFLKDRHDFAKEAIKNGAVALVVEREIQDVNIPRIIVKDARHTMAVMAAHFYNYPSYEMKVIGVTGTNGKTTTSHLIEKIFSDYQFKTGIMGNNGIKMNGTIFPTDINTQEPPVLQRNFRKMRDLNTEYCVMEVTSQGLDMGRVVGCNFNIAIFTNLTQDHLDYHGSFEEYRDTKGLLFSRLGNSFHHSDKKFVVLNSDDPAFEVYRKLTTAEVITYGINHDSDVVAKNIKITSTGIEFLLSTFRGDIQIDLSLVGGFNVYNALAAISCALIEGIPLTNIKESLSKITSVEGRMEVVNEGQEFLTLVDYAHTPDALENVLTTIKEFSKGNIITVFGCGGDRDKTKRQLMGEIASKYSNFVYITSDNPRSEDPMNIIKEITNGMDKEDQTKYKSIVNREKAIMEAMKMAKSNDVVLIAGKGQETYQILKDKTIHFDDREVARKAILDCKR